MEDNIKRLFDISKTLKGNTVSFYNNRIMSLNSDMNPIYSISIVYTDTQLQLENNMCIKMETFKSFVKGDILEEYIPLQSPKGIKEAYILDSFVEPKQDQMIHFINDLKQYDQFNSALSKKSKDGMQLVYIDNYPISICAGLLPINKSDNVSLEIYNDNVPNTFLCKFNIDKKKFVINKYIRYLYL